MALYSRKDCALITVEELCAAAGVARTTFYAHYDTTDDIKKEIEDELISGLLLVTEKAAAGDLPSMDFVPFLDEIQAYIRAHWEAFRAFLVVQPNARFVAAWKESIKQNFARRYLPNVATFSMCASITNIARKSDGDLREPSRLGVNDLYVGVETGLTDVLSFMNKGNSAEDARTQLLRLNESGIRHRPLIMLGIAGKGRGRENALSTAELLNATKPDAVCCTNLYVFLHTKLSCDVEGGQFVPADVVESLKEEKTLIENLMLPECYFWASYYLNYIHVEGKLGTQKEEMLSAIEKGIQKYMREPFPKITHSLM